MAQVFLVGIAETSEVAIQTLSEILDLKSRLERKIQTEWGRRTNNALLLFNYLFKDPVIDVKRVENVCGLSFKTANVLVSSFEKEGILKEITGQSRNRMFRFDPYISLFK